MKSKNKRVKYPIEYNINPLEIEEGVSSINTIVTNIGLENLYKLNIKMNSLDPYGIFVYETSKTLKELRRNKRKDLIFKVMGKRTSRVYLSIDGKKDSEKFHWESAYVKIKVGRKAADLIGIFSLSDPYPQIGKLIRFEAVLEGLDESENLRLGFWADTPEGEFKQMDILETKWIRPGEQSRYTAELTPDIEGVYTIHAYLYDQTTQIGHEITRVWVEEG